MAYTELLNQMIQESGLSANEICRLCQADGVDLKPTYLSMLRNDSTRRPSDERSRAIAKACGKPEDWLVTQARLDQDTKILEKMRANIRESVVAAIAMIFKSLGYPDFMEQATAYINALPEVELLQEYASIDMDIMRTGLEEVLTNGTIVKSLNQLNLVELPVEDDAMAPMLPKGGRVHVEVCEYKDGDMLCYQKPGDKTCYIRYVRFLDNTHNEVMMIAHNRGYPPETLRLDELFIYGKVKRLVVDFE